NLALPEPLSSTKPLRLNYMYLNTGNQAATNARIYAHSYLTDDDPYLMTTSEQVWKEFADGVSKTREIPVEIQANIPFWSTQIPPYPVLTQPQIDNTRNN